MQFDSLFVCAFFDLRFLRVIYVLLEQLNMNILCKFCIEKMCLNDYITTSASSVFPVVAHPVGEFCVCDSILSSVRGHHILS